MKRTVFFALGMFAGTAFAADSITFHKDVEPILQAHCQSCHRPGQTAPMSLLSYESARPWAKAMKNAVLTRKMPPWFADPRYGHFKNDRSLRQSDVDTIARRPSGQPTVGRSNPISSSRAPNLRLPANLKPT